MASEGAAHGTAVVARRQTRGRGRRGRTWWSPDAGNLYVSVILRPAGTDLETLPALAPAAGLAVAEAIERVAGVNAGLKWPNDVRVGGKKVAGVLAESQIAGGTVSSVVIGIGINVNVDRVPDELADVATSLARETGKTFDLEELLEQLLASLDAVSEQFCASGFATLVDRWNERHALQDQPVRVDTPGGLVEGIARGVDASGGLILETASGRETVSLGEVL